MISKTSENNNVPHFLKLLGALTLMFALIVTKRLM
jgi:hypothetical protein